MTNTKVRESNFELLRIIAMFMVLVLHADFIALGEPNKMDIISSPWISSIKVLLEMASIVAVNVFVLISGWFGIRPSVKGFLNFVFQCLFFSVGIYLTMILVGNQEFSIRDLISCFTFNDSYWFVLAYACLYIISPILNTFLEYADKRTCLIVIATFFIFQTLFSCILGSAVFLRRGYSTLSFAGLYLLINYIKKYINFKNLRAGFLYIILTVLGSLIVLSAKYFECDFFASRFFDYSNPIVIFSSVCLLLFFSKLKFQSSFVNNIARSCFAVYLLHCNNNLWDIYLESVQCIVVNHTLFEYLSLFAMLLMWFIAAVVIDQVRMLFAALIFRLKCCKLDEVKVKR